ncbi:MAG: Na-translocating system protein MpsC family protein, partial [Deferrisomatales bacterium]
MEDELAKAFVAFEKEYMGRGPREAAAHILRDLVLV